MLPVQNILPAALAEMLAEAPGSPGKLQFAWRVAVGPAVARMTVVAMGEGQRLLIRAADPLWRREVERALPVIRERLAALLGGGALAGIDVVED